MTPQEEARFEQDLLSAVDQAKAFGYRPTRFLGLIRSKGAFRSVKDIVASGKASEGFHKLVLHGRTDLTCEAIIVENEWRSHFDDDLLEIAERRLRDYGYAFKPHVQSTPERAVPDGAEQALSARSSKDSTSATLEFEPPEEDQRGRAFRQIHDRPGQARFRQILIDAYGERCCITGPTIAVALEAAHITAYRGEQSDHVQNGLLLRADLHRLFDRFCFGINPSTFQLHLGKHLAQIDQYASFDGRALDFTEAREHPSLRAIRMHWEVFCEMQNEVDYKRCG